MTQLRPSISLLTISGLFCLFGCCFVQPMAAREIELVIVGDTLIKVHPEKHWKERFTTIRPILAKADVAFCNFEMAIDDKCGLSATYNVAIGEPKLSADNRPGNTADPHAVDESVMAYLSSLNFKLMSLANNHAWDLGPCGIRATIAAAQKYGVAHAGTGSNLEQATEAVYLHVGEVKIALLAAVTSLDERSKVIASNGSHGVNGVWTGWQEDWDRNIEAVTAARGKADFVLFYHHFQIREPDVSANPELGHRDVGDVYRWQQRFAEAVIDAGAGMYLAHGWKKFRGLRMYKSRPIFRQFGMFCYQGKRDQGDYPSRKGLYWTGLLGKLRIRDGSIRAMEFLPVAIDEGDEQRYGDATEFREKRGFPEIATGDLAKRILEKFKEQSAANNVEIKINEETATYEVE